MSAVNPTRILLVDEDTTTLDLVRSALGPSYEIAQVRTGEEAFARAMRTTPDLAIIEAALPGMDGYTLTRNWRQAEATRGLPIVMLTVKNDIGDKVLGFEAGVDDYLTKPFQAPELAYRVKNLLQRSHTLVPQETKPRRRARVITVFGTKGGVGKTTLAVNLAVALQRRTQKRVALFDCDFFFGDISLHMNLTPSSTVMDLIDRMDQLDPDLIEHVMLQHPSGVRVLLSPPQPELAEQVTADHVERLVKALSEMYDYVIVDCHPNYDDRNLVVLEQADQIMFVVRPELGPLKNMGVFLNLALKLGLPLTKIFIVLNRAGSKSGIEVEQIERNFKSRIAFRMVSGGRTVTLSMNRGVPLVLDKPRHPLAKQIVGIADYVARQSPNGHIPSAGH